jgi:hypothetical protein
MGFVFGADPQFDLHNLLGIVTLAWALVVVLRYKGH